MFKILQSTRKNSPNILSQGFIFTTDEESLLPSSQQCLMGIHYLSFSFKKIYHLKTFLSPIGNHNIFQDDGPKN